MSLAIDKSFLAEALSVASGMQISNDIQTNYIDLEYFHKQCLVWGDVNLSSFSDPGKCRASTSPVKLFIKTLSGETLEIAASTQDTTYALKERIYERLPDTPPHLQRLIFAGKQLEDDLSLLDNNIRNGCTIHLVLRLRGGGVIKFELDSDILDPLYNHDFSNERRNRTFMRGDFVYKRPYGWSRIAFNVKKKYDDATWLGGTDHKLRSESVVGEWPVSYHGTDQQKAMDIAKKDFDLTKGKRFLFGRGIYSTTDPDIAERYCKQFEYKGEWYKVMIQSRVNMDDTVFIEHKKYFVTAHDSNIRPYGLLYKKVPSWWSLITIRPLLGHAGFLHSYDKEEEAN